MSVRVAIEPALRGRVPASVVRRLVRVARRGAARLGLAKGGATLGVRLVDDAAMIELQRRHLGTAVPTDVLSFPPVELPFAEDRPAAGDVAIDWDQVMRQASAPSVAAWTEEAAQLLVHGLAHLAGHDHDTPAHARKMLFAEIRAARTAGITTPHRPYANAGTRRESRRAR
jgi:probable rRNA maturation factor